MKPNKSWIHTDSEEILKEKTAELTFPLSLKDTEYIEKMRTYIDASYDESYKKFGINPGIAIAANQIGWDKSVIYIHFKAKQTEYQYLLANPKIISYSQGIAYLENGEGCLSVPTPHPGIVPRRAKVVVEALDLLNNNKTIKIKAGGILAINLQHEIDHLNGILYYDHINKKNPQYVNEDWTPVNFEEEQ